MSRNYETLDAILIVAGLLIIGGSIAGLFLLTVPSDNLPIVSGLVGTLLGTVIGGYTGFRWSSTTRSRSQDARLVSDETDTGRHEQQGSI
jgi:hypothetical protein